MCFAPTFCFCLESIQSVWPIASSQRNLISFGISRSSCCTSGSNIIESSPPIGRWSTNRRAAMSQITFVVGFVFGIALASIIVVGSIVEVVGVGIFFAVMFYLFHHCAVAHASLAAKRKQFKNRIRSKSRTESTGSFSQRLERFSGNLEPIGAHSETESKLNLWESPDAGEYETSPPKPVSAIRFLLLRIKKILSSK